MKHFQHLAKRKKFHKEMSCCRSCGKRYELNKDSAHFSRYYCETCFNKARLYKEQNKENK